MRLNPFGPFGFAGLAVDEAGQVYIAHQVGNRVRRIGPDGTVITIAGRGEAGLGGDGSEPEMPLSTVPPGWPSTMQATCLSRIVETTRFEGSEHGSSSDGPRPHSAA